MKKRFIDYYLEAVTKKEGSGGGSATLIDKNITANGTYNALDDSADGYKKVVVNVPTGGGGGGDADDDVIFIDYDGTIVDSYTKEDFLALSAMPENPSHEGLTAQRWNWSFADAQAYVRKYGALVVGQMYITDDGKTRIFVSLNAGTLNPYVGIGLNGTAEVDWGDGSAPDTITGTSLTSLKYASHNYSQKGDYVITIDVKSGSASLFGASNGTSYYRTALLRSTSGSATSTNQAVDRTYAKCIHGVMIGDGITNLGNYAFVYCYSLQFVVIPDGVTISGTTQFSNCFELKSITIPDDATSLPNSSFSNCYELQSIAIPNGVTSAGGSVFSSCHELQAVTLPEGITSIGSSIASDCYSLRTFIIPDGVTSIAANALTKCYALESLIIPEGVISIGSSAFSYCYNLKSVKIPDSVTSLGNTMMMRCFGLLSLTLPEGITNIPGICSSCYGLETITIPDSVTSISDSAFDSASLVEIHVLPQTPPTIGSNSFTKYDNMVIYVPYSEDHSILDAYKAATNWSSFASYMQEEPQ